MSKQNKWESTIEVALNTGSGFLLSWGAYAWVVIPYNHWFVLHSQAFSVTVMFTVISLIRSYVWRRFFNANLHRAIKRAFTR